MAYSKKSAAQYPVNVILPPVSINCVVTNTNTVTITVVNPIDALQNISGTTFGRTSSQVYRKNAPWTNTNTNGATQVTTVVSSSSGVNLTTVYQETDVPAGTWYYAVINTNQNNAISSLAASATDVGAVSLIPVIANAIQPNFIGGGDVTISLSNPADTNRSTAAIWRKTDPWTSNDTTGATLVQSISGSAAIEQTYFDLNLPSDIYYYTVINTGPNGAARRDASSIEVIADPAVSVLNTRFPGLVGTSLSSDWTVTPTNVGATSSVINLGNDTARVRLGKLSGTEGKYLMEYNTTFNLDYPTEEDSRVVLFEHSHPGAIEMNLYMTNESGSLDPESASKWVCITYSTLSNANGVITVRTKTTNGQVETINTVATVTTGAGTTISNILEHIMFVGNTLKVAITNRLGVTTELSLSSTSHPFTPEELQRMSLYTTFRNTSTSTVDVTLERLMVFENQGESLVTNLRITPLKADDTRWTVGEDTGLYVKTRFDADVPVSDDSQPTSYIIEIDDIQLAPVSAFPVVVASTLSFDTAHQIQVYSVNRSPFPASIDPGTAPPGAPTLTVNGPATGSTISTSQAFAAVASSSKGIREVRWYVDNRVRSIDSTAPYDFTLDPTKYTSGQHVFEAIAVGNDGLITNVSRTYTFGVASPTADATGPTITMTNPIDATIIASNYNVYVEATDPAGIKKVEFIMDGVIKSTSISPSYVFIINPYAYTDGAHTFTVKAYDTNDNVTTINRSITIETPDLEETSLILGDINNIEPKLKGRPEIIWYGSFDGTPNWYSTWYLDAGSPTPTNTGNLSVVTRNSLDSKALRVKHPGSAVFCNATPRFDGGGGTGPGGTKAFVDISTMGVPDQQELYIRYYVRFDPGFTWVGGGLLPGLGGGTLPHECGDSLTATGGGWSGLHAWGKDGRIGVNLFANRIGTSLMNDCGMNRFFRVDGQQRNLLRPGVWHCIEARYLLNTAGQNNGTYQAWFDNKEALTLNEVRYRDTGQTFKIETLIFASLFKGEACNWWPKTTQYVQFDSFVLGKSRIGPR
jgi:hypothetical protein